MSREKGQIVEQQVQTWLQQRGLTPVAHNFHCRMGELDLVMQQRNELVFIEVKYRQTPGFGGAIGAVTQAKQRRLRQTAALFLQQRDWNDRPCRFDVVTVVGDRIDWIQNAF
ncbi:YraN family protein [Ferrimonas sp. SCSIO 43195]|uniref:YraN family protein n=1 Tax=Ferrimonas sp. SCSIO 43195 TaxID=2822844 RepID=UPI00207650DF|nr:YraN family protein [Ferrimonas sp. SCSIO 43195]USD37903.1 YraN family protein [Ferrimonas sp. SCSIO 43195]